ncbi:hypothetical protein BAE44_0022188 [Dichanthelium oligosanthes]|uniref:Uncharacterized protein n=1 Tax=Dichanthelium oligosanthes TaxID=888268 RepID=A0A1E5UVE8_9POAL|nr:hypothetical protein BAE44_0022188 [Dichanthelium oligosanthes]
MDVLDGLSSSPPPPPKHDTARAAASDAKPRKEAKILEAQPCPLPRKTTVVCSRRVTMAKSYAPSSAPIASTRNAKPSANMGAPTVVPAQQPKKTPPVVVSVADEKTKMEATKRKLHDRYQEIEDAKRQRTIQVIKPPRPPPGQRQRNAHPAVRERGPARCAAERVFVKSCSLRMRV